jgi:alpha-1,4-digalacturonate transport system substrate-binding protein
MEDTMKKTKVLLLMAVMILSCAVVFAGGQNDSGSADKPITLYHTGDDGNALQMAAERYLEETGKVVEVIQIPYDSHREKVIGMIRAKKAPAILKTTDPIAFGDFALPLDTVINTANLPDATKGNWNYKGNVISLPVTATANGLWINKTLFDLAGVAYPKSKDEVWTWDECTKAILEVKNKTGVLYALGWDVTPHRWSTLLYEFGGSIFVEDEKKAAISTPKSVEALKYFVKLHDDGVISRAFWIGNENPRDAFMGGQMVAHLSGSWMTKEYFNIDTFDAALTYLPSAEKRSSLLGGNYMMILEGSGLEKEAKDFMKWFTSNDQFSTYIGQVPTIAPLMNVKGKFDDPEIQEWMDIFQDELEATSSSAGYDWAIADGTVRNKMMPVYKDMIIAAVKGDKSPQEAFDTVNKAITDAFEVQ